ncbi:MULTISPECIES: hypothetical protein [unclassified Polaromonas]|jgi:hypothetical protein|uniref:hypothetical protein n=1 Tax=unclassified Polaromonas TaxID=2638319 RepID=UPI000BCE1474|nr:MULTISPECIES: hypothetical protein [unclassified Polaromonas]OYY38504.1 MAG: hypothetical protein B7Y60_04500 [Polaromonas sp. 35-63-35]OYZ21338.1 MAG: hypothetical protein B7Y28_05705 [Polaromonas sp. 16-63-31]OYZ79093.1 MAG: hypothetical protein B7Y09_09825 [Polaromonas sp. 24-63-21]OZA50242.1 MAG: hypothetical protein B7X88_11925 [Polaromonas sp. 17-63-33]OZA89261.1 MAG: hypothetical protein B7X65_04660 [Polaromonas sp. 39-63-25]
MDTTIVYVDEAAHALDMLAPLLQPGQARAPTRWIVVGCAPRITHRVSKWVTHSARESWRGKWAEKVFEQIVPLLQASGDPVITHLACGSLDEFTATLRARHGEGRLVDARRPRPGADLQSARGPHPGEPRGVWGFAAMLAGSGLLLTVD